MREVIEMACMLLAVSREHPGDRHFFEVLFDRIDKKRPLLITDKKGGAA